jgi:hypothetical protein
VAFAEVEKAVGRREREGLLAEMEKGFIHGHSPPARLSRFVMHGGVSGFLLEFLFV